MTQQVYENLLEVYENASDEARRVGMSWYTEAEGIVRQIARTYNVTTNLVAAVMAAASTNSMWQRNIDLTWYYMEQLSRYGKVRDQHFGFVLDKINAAWSKRRDYAKILRGKVGLKLEAFYKALAGQDDSVAVDRHMVRAAGYPDTKAGMPSITTKRTREIQAAIQRIAAEHGHVSARQVQAIIWVAVLEK